MKSVVLRGLQSLGVFSALRTLRRDAAVIACYHGVMPGSDDSYDFLHANFVAASAFEEHMRWLATRYRLVPLRTIVEAIHGGGRLPARAATVTFDDGFANNYRVAFPILQRLGVPATIFLTTEKIGVPGAQLWTERVKRAIYLSSVSSATVRLGDDDATTYTLDGATARERVARSLLGRLKRASIEQRDEWLAEIERSFGRPQLGPGDAMRNDFLTWDEVRHMADAGIEIGSHTVSHPILTSIDDERLTWELTESKRVIESQLGRTCYAFAYPNGGAEDFGTREMEAIDRAGYTCALSLQGGLAGRNSDRLAIDRVNIAREHDLVLLDALLSGALASVRHLRTIARGAG